MLDFPEDLSKLLKDEFENDPSNIPLAFIEWQDRRSNNKKENKMNEEFLTPQEAASLLKVNVMTIYRYVNAGKIKAYRFGSVFRIKKEDFNKFLEQSKITKGGKNG